MEIRRSGQETGQGPAAHFAGPVWMDRIATPSAASAVAVFSVHFAPGSRTAWHTHGRGQWLHVTEGAGLVQRRGGEVERIGPGDTVWSEPGEWHWHGATRSTFMTHLAISEAVDGATAQWGEHVTEEYPA